MSAVDLWLIIVVICGAGWLICECFNRRDRRKPPEQVRPIGDAQQDAAFLAIAAHWERENADRLYDDGTDL